MFTGIIEGTGEIKNIIKNIFTISHSFGERFCVGESIAVNGMCSTVLRSDESVFEVEIIEESRKLTIFGTAFVGDKINLERSAIIGARNSGHNVTGHIDQVGKILKLERQEDYWLIRVEVEPSNRKLLVHKGSVALSGISLTVSGISSQEERETAWFEVSIISHTWEATNLNNLKIGNPVNVEFDVLGKYNQSLDEFDVWNWQKKQLGKKNEPLYFHEREVFFMYLGKNVGFEQDGKGKDFLRPVLVVKKFNRYFFWGIPLTAKKPKPNNPYYFYVGEFKGKDNWAIVSQGRAFDALRLSDKVGIIPKPLNESLRQTAFKLLF